MATRPTALWRIALGIALGALGFVSLAPPRSLEPPPAAASTAPTVASCPTLPTDGVWNTRVDLRGRRRAAHPARPSALRRGRRGRDRACPPLHGVDHAASIRLARSPLRVDEYQPDEAAHGNPCAAEVQLRHLGLQPAEPRD